MTEDVFLRAMLDNPRDDVSCLVYADWLDEQGNAESIAKAEFLRLTVQLAAGSETKGKRRATRTRLRQLAAKLDTNWLAVVSRLRIENCTQKQSPGSGVIPLHFEFLCDRRWEDMQATEDRTVRFCHTCQQNVHYCDTIMQAREHARQWHCVAIDLGIKRREGDLERPHMWLGRPSPETVRAEEDRMLPDPVSAERERRKQELQQQQAPVK